MADYTCPRCGRTGNKGEYGWHFFADRRFLVEARLEEPVCASCAAEIIGRESRAVIEENRQDPDD